jgi:SSS family solute:Na+ symporter
MGGQGLYEIVPGFIAAWLAIVIVSKATGTARPARG